MTLHFLERPEIFRQGAPMDIKHLAMMELEDERLLEKKYRLKLASLPAGKLTATQHKGKNYYKRRYDGKYEYVGTDTSDIVKNLKLRKYLEESISVIENNRSLLEPLCACFRPLDPAHIITALPQAYRPADGEIYDNPYYVDYRRWENSPYVKDERFDRFMTFETEKGHMVSSLSEAVIADMLFSRGISYHYREQIQVCDTILYPSFCVGVKSDSRFKIIDHCGDISGPECLSTFLFKLKSFVSAGFIPWKDVFFTFDNSDGTVDEKDVALLIEAHLR